jgi:diguanylate cyclase (GGDEF)-like protein/PAS domain S-box-containing protein
MRLVDPAPSHLLTERAAQVALNSIGDGVGCTDLDGRITFLNAAAERLTGWPATEAIGRPMADVIRIVDPLTHQSIPDLTMRAVGGDETVHLPPNSVLLTRDGQEIAVEDSTAPIHDDDGRTTGAVIVFRDVSDARAALELVSHSAQHDPLTGLPNRTVLSDRISQAIGAAPRHSGQLAVMYLDLDGFKEVNDTLGHPIGDLLLQSVAERLVTCVRASDTVSRAGGDEFVVLLTEAEQAADASIIAARMLKSVAALHLVHGHRLRVTASIGVAVFPGDGDDPDTLIKNADLAMYRVKANGRSAFQFYDAATALLPAVHAADALRRGRAGRGSRAPHGAPDGAHGLPTGTADLVRARPRRRHAPAD